MTRVNGLTGMTKETDTTVMTSLTRTARVGGIITMTKRLG